MQHARLERRNTHIQPLDGDGMIHDDCTEKNNAETISQLSRFHSGQEMESRIRKRNKKDELSRPVNNQKSTDAISGDAGPRAQDTVR